MVNFFRNWGPACGYAGLIFYLSSLPYPERELPSFVALFSDKVLHVVEYAILGGFCYWGFRWGTNESWRPWAGPLAIVLASLFGMSDEVHQAYVPFREASLLDWVADTIGAILGAVVTACLLNLRSAVTATDMPSQR